MSQTPEHQGRRAEIARMADFMRERAAFSEGVTEDDLIRAGYSPDEVADIAKPAGRSASRRAVRRVA